MPVVITVAGTNSLPHCKPRDYGRTTVIRIAVARPARGDNRRMSWLDSVPLWLIVAVAAWMAMAPIVPEPHLVEKLRMLSQGTLRRPLDIFDLLWHLAPLVVLALKLVRMWQARGGA